MANTKQDGMKAALTCQKYVPVLRETTKDGVKEQRQLVLKGDFHIFVDGQAHPVKLPCKLEFRDEPSTVQLVQQALNIEDTGEQCLVVVYSNRQKRLDKYFAELDQMTKQQELKFPTTIKETPDEDEEDMEDEEDEDVWEDDD